MGNKPKWRQWLYRAAVILAFAPATATTIGGLSDTDVILVNNTGLPIARIEIDHRIFEAADSGLPPANKVLITVTPTSHNLKIVFRGGALVKWPHLNFGHVHEIYFERMKNKIELRID